MSQTDLILLVGFTLIGLAAIVGLLFGDAR